MKQVPGSALSPEIESLLGSADPFTTAQEEAMSLSNKNTAEIPHTGFSRLFTPSEAPRPQFGKRRLRRVGFALAAGSALIVGAVFLGPWGSSPLPLPPASPSSTEQGFNPLVPASFQAFSDAGGITLTGRIRPVLPGDPASVSATGWVMDIYVISGDPKNTGDPLYQGFEQDVVVPIDLGGRNTGGLYKEFETHSLGILAVVMDTYPDGRVISPAPGPYGVLLSDRKLLASSSADAKDARSLTTFDGTPVDTTDTRLSSSGLAQFADFRMLNEFSGVSDLAPSLLEATSFTSHVDAEANACILASSERGNKVLAFTAGSTASSSFTGESPDLLVGSMPLRVSAPYQVGDNLDLGKFVLDTGENPSAKLQVWPTGKTGSCGGTTGEIVNFAGPKT